MIKTYLKEKIGNPELFTGRKREMAYFLDWVDGAKEQISQSMALLSRRKTGKSALMQRLYNVTFHRNNTVIPFYYEIKESAQWLPDFSIEFFFTFIYQYIAFKTRKIEYFKYPKADFQQALETVKKEKFDYLELLINNIQYSLENRLFDNLWNTARDAPRMVAWHYGDRVVQLIDEFQFINRFIFRDEPCKNRIDNLAASYLHTCEYKNAPLLVSGSWVGWLMTDLNRMLPGRFLKYPLENMPEDEAIETVFKYSLLRKIPVTEQTAYLIAGLTEGNPFYISALFGSRYPGKDLATEKGVRDTLEFETLVLDANINATWMEYLDSAFSRINDIHAKDMVLYLSKNRHRYVSRKELKDKLGLDMTDADLEKKFKALYRADIIEEDYGRYRGVRDNIFDKVFRRSYAKDIDKFLAEEAPNEYKALFEDILKKYRAKSGEFGRYKGAFAEFMMWHHLKENAHKNNDRFKSMMNNLPDDFEFSAYASILSYHSPPLYEPEFQIDVFARAGEGGYSLIGEVKNRKAKFSVGEAEIFLKNAGELVKIENIEKYALFVFSTGGFFKNTLGFLKKHGIAWTSDMRWLKKS